MSRIGREPIAPRPAGGVVVSTVSDFSGTILTRGRRGREFLPAALGDDGPRQHAQIEFDVKLSRARFRPLASANISRGGTISVLNLSLRKGYKTT